MQNVSAVAVPLDPLASYIYIQHETSRTCQQPRPGFTWILPLGNIIFPIIDQWSWSSNIPFYEKKDFVALFHGWGSTVPSLEPLWGGSLLFTIKFPEIPGTHFYQPLMKDEEHKYRNLIQRKEYRSLSS